jgi:N-hydroxyarylamine O-acetyltransferase
MDLPDLNAYFRRIGYSGPHETTLETLRALHLHHPLSIPFENLDPLLRRPVRLDLRSLERKLVREERGGYCFEQNLLFGHVLRHLGFRITCLAARVLWNVPAGALRPRGHMLLQIELDGDAPSAKRGPSGAGAYIADVGFGGLTLTAPLHLAPDIEQTTPRGTFRLLAADGHFVLQAKVRSDWQSLYRFDLQPQFEVDYEVSSWYVSTHPASVFVNNLMAARTTRTGRLGLFNNLLSVHDRNGDTEQRTLTTPAQMRSVLETDFGVRLPDEPLLDSTLAAIVSGTLR